MTDTHRGSAPRVEVLESAESLTRAAAGVFVECASAASRARGRFVVALSGGSTPNALYELLATDAFVRRVDWARVEVFWGDERCVPRDDETSNYRGARERLLDRVPLSAGAVHPIDGEGDPAEAAAGYERELRASFATPWGPPRAAPRARFDLVLLGLGLDGHTASLFPSTAAVRESKRWVVAHHVAAVEMGRITLTPPVLNAAAEVLFLVTGRDKAAILRRVLEGPYEPDLLPAQAIAPHAGRLRFMVDADAARELTAPA